MTLVDDTSKGIYHTVESFCSELVRRLSGRIEGSTVVFDTLDETLTEGGYQPEKLICVGPPVLEFERDSNRPSDVLTRFVFTVQLYCEKARGNEGNAIPEVLSTMYDMLDAVLPVLVSADIHGYQFLIESAEPVTRPEMTQKQYDIKCFIEKQTEYQPCL